MAYKSRSYSKITLILPRPINPSHFIFPGHNVSISINFSVFYIVIFKLFTLFRLYTGWFVLSSKPYTTTPHSVIPSSQTSKMWLSRLLGLAVKSKGYWVAINHPHQLWHCLVLLISMDLFLLIFVTFLWIFSIEKCAPKIWRQIGHSGDKSL